MIPTATLLVLLVAAASIGRAESVVVTPLFQQVQYPGKVTVDCQFPNRPLTACRVRVAEHTSDKDLDSLLDFGNGSQSASVRLRSRGGYHSATASFRGAGLARGECGVQLELVLTLTVLVECIGQSEDRTWSRGFGLVTSSAASVLPVIVPTPRVMVVTPHSDVAVVLKTSDGRPLDLCSIETPSAGLVHLTPTEALAADTRYRHDSTGLARGECALTLTNVTQRDAGVWDWYGLQDDSMAEQATLVLVQAVPEGLPQLTVAGPAPLVVGSTLNASCRTPPAVPPANITWLLGNEVLRPPSADNDTQPGDVGVLWPWEPQSTVQTLTLTLTQDDPGKRLVCRMTHQGMEQDRSAWHDLPVLAEDACGRRRVTVGTPLSAGGEEAKEVEFPWQVAVYKARTTNGIATYAHICGGSLVSPRFFISAAHCFWHSQLQKLQDATLYQAVLGKHHRAWTTKDTHEQRRAVKAIHVPIHYEGSFKHFQADIALVQLERPVRVTSGVDAVCVDWGRAFEYLKHPMAANSTGTVPGWGLTENGRQSDTLHYVDLPFVTSAECHDAVPFDQRALLTLDKICGGYQNRQTGVCVGDSGGGYVFPEEKAGTTRYFLRGVVSTAPTHPGRTLSTCRPEHVSFFTLVSAYASWMKTIMAVAEAEAVRP